jgi:hypothetical protein
MSARNIKQQQQSKPFCKVCQDAGKSEQVYTSHYVKSAPGTGGKVVCPTLLSLQCGYCFQSGHTPKFCPVITKNKALDEKAKRREAEPAKTKEMPKKKTTNVFAALNSDDDSETENVSKKQVITAKKSQTQNIIVAATKSTKSKEEEFPALPTNKGFQSTPSKTISGYAAAAAKPVYDVEEFNNATSLKALQRQMPPLQKAISKENAIPEDAADDDSWTEAYVPRPAPLLASKIDWAQLDNDSSDDEDW